MTAEATGTSLRERILAADDLGSEIVEIPEWEEWLKGDKLHVRGLTAGEVEEIGREVNEGKLANVMARLAVKVTTNGDGSRVFTDEDADALGGKSPNAVKALFDAAQRISGLGEEPGEAGKG